MRTPGPELDESPIGYAVRLSETNGYHKSSILVGLVENRSEYIITIGWDYQRLNRVLGARQLPPDFGYGPKSTCRHINASLLGRPIHSRHLGVLKARICVPCIKELGYAPAKWDLKAFVACPVHGLMMLKYCRACGRRIRCMRPGLLRCNCGADLTESTQEIAQPALVGLSEILEARVERKSKGCIVARACGMPVDDLLRCDLENLCRIIVRIATILSWRARAKRTPRFNKELIECLPEVGQVFSNWPAHFYRFCEDWHRRVISSAVVSRDFQRNFSWLFVQLYKNLRRSKDQTRFIVHAALAYGVRHWDQCAIQLREPALRALPLPPRRYGSYRDVAKLLGWESCTVLHWLRHNRLKASRTRESSTHPGWVIDLEELGRAKLSRHRAVRERQAAHLLGINIATYRGLRRLGLIPEQHIVKYNKSAAIEDIESFRNSVLSRATQPPRGKKLHSLRKFLHSKVPVEHKIDTIVRIHEGRLAVYLQGNASIGNLLTPDDLTQAYFARRRVFGLGDRLFMSEAQRKYCLSRSDAWAVFRILGENIAVSGRKTRIHASRIECFLAQYIPVGKIAREAHLDYRMLRNAIQMAEPDSLLAVTLAGRPNAHADFVKQSALSSAKLIAGSLCRAARN